MNKGIVMEIQDDRLVVLTNDGQFMAAKKNEKVPYQLGEEISFTPIIENTVKGNSIFSKSYRAVASLAAIFVLVLASFIISTGLSETKVYAYVTVDINPSFELTVNEDLEIIDIVPLNKDAQIILEQIHEWKDQPLPTVTASLVQTSKDQGYLTEEETVVVSTVVLEKEEKKEQQLDQAIKEVQHKIEESQVKVKWLEGTKEDREQATEEGISTGKFIEEKTKGKNNSSEQNKKNENKPSDDENNSEKDDNGKSKDQKNNGQGENKGNNGNNGNNGNKGNSGNNNNEEKSNKGNNGNNGNNGNKGQKGNNGKNPNEENDNDDRFWNGHQSGEEEDKSRSNGRGSDREKNGNGQNGQKGNNGNNGNDRGN